MKGPVVKTCRICGTVVTPHRRPTRKAYWYPRQCQDCFKKDRWPELRKKRISEATRGLKHPLAVPLGSNKIVYRGRYAYRTIKISDTGKWPYEHRVVAEQKIGRALLPGEVVHHLNRDSLDNRPENLAVLSVGEHTTGHLSITRWSKAYDSCLRCGTTVGRHVGRGLCNACYHRFKKTHQLS